MSALKYVYEIDRCPDQEVRSQTLKATVEEQWPGSTVELGPHPMGGLRARIILAEAGAADEFEVWLELGSPTFGTRFFARSLDRGP